MENCVSLTAGASKAKVRSRLSYASERRGRSVTLEGDVRGFSALVEAVVAGWPSFMGTATSVVAFADD